MAVTVSTGALLGAAAIAAGASAAGSGISLFSNWQANQKNEALNRENLAFQRETFEYQKALQQQIFEREDTAYQRAAADAQQVGINPMALAGSGGANAGQAIDVTTPQNNMQYKSLAEGIDFSSAISSSLGAIDSINGVLTGKKERDLLQSQIDMNNFQTLLSATQAGFRYDSKTNSFVYDPDSAKHPSYKILENQAKDTQASAERNERVNAFQNNFGVNDMSPQEYYMATHIAKTIGEADMGSHSWTKFDPVQAPESLQDDDKGENEAEKAFNGLLGLLSGAYRTVTKTGKKIIKKINKSSGKSGQAMAGRMY